MSATGLWTSPVYLGVQHENQTLRRERYLGCVSRTQALSSSHFLLSTGSQKLASVPVILTVVKEVTLWEALWQVYSCWPKWPISFLSSCGYSTAFLSCTVLLVGSSSTLFLHSWSQLLLDWLSNHCGCKYGMCRDIIVVLSTQHYYFTSLLTEPRLCQDPVFPWKFLQFSISPSI